MYLQNEKIVKLWFLSIFLTREGLNNYIRLLCKMKLWDELQKKEVVCKKEEFCKKVVLENFTKFTGKHFCWSLF